MIDSHVCALRMTEFGSVQNITLKIFFLLPLFKFTNGLIARMHNDETHIISYSNRDIQKCSVMRSTTL